MKKIQLIGEQFKELEAKYPSAVEVHEAIDPTSFKGLNRIVNDAKQRRYKGNAHQRRVQRRAHARLSMPIGAKDFRDTLKKLSCRRRKVC